MIRGFRSTIAMTMGVALLAAGLATAVFAQGEGRRGPGGPGYFGRGGGPGFPLAQLGLTDAQREQVKKVMESHRGEMRTVGTRLRQAFDAQRTAVETVPVNEALIRSTSQALSNAQTDMALLRARVHSEVWQLLTPDQQQKAKELQAQREQRRKERMQQRQQRMQQRQQQQG